MAYFLQKMCHRSLSDTFNGFDIINAVLIFYDHQQSHSCYLYEKKLTKALIFSFHIGNKNPGF